jgi:hypothetical protein
MWRPTSHSLSLGALALVVGCINPVGDGLKQSTTGAWATLDAKNARLAKLPRTDLVGPTGLRAFSLQGEETAKVGLSLVPVTDMPFSRALRLALKDEASHEWAVQLRAPTAAPVRKGDAILATFYLRTEVPQEGGVGETQFVFELAHGPYTKSVTYPVQGGATWSKVYVRFQAAADYAPGEAQMIFRLGYTPQVIHIGGISVEDFGKDVTIDVLPTTQAIDRRREREALAAIEAAQAADTTIKDGGTLRFAVNPGKVIRTISPYVYGLNAQPDDDIGVPVRRSGGNRQTGYNWEIDASNAGSDYLHSSDRWACEVLGFKDCDKPGAQYVDFARGNRASGRDSLVVIPLVDYVVADHDGPVRQSEAAPSPRWKRSLPKKPSSFVLTPDTSDDVVYQDEFVNFLVHTLGKASTGGIKFYALDNEPALWPSTHPFIHPDRTRYDEVVSRSTATAEAITSVDPSAFVLGGTMFGWSEYMSLNEAPDAQQHNADFGTYVDYFLASMKAAEAQHHRRLVHALDVHWYPEALGSKRITTKDVSSKTIAARLQAPRSLWDPTYKEKSWITAQWGKPIRLIPWLLERIDARYPGTKLAITEYDYGAGDHISGGLAQVDALGVFGREGVYLASYWGSGAGYEKLPPYVKAAFMLYRNYDGKHGAYGDTAIEAKTSDSGKSTIFAANDSKHSGRLTIIVINKEQHTAFSGKIDLHGAHCAKAHVFAIDGGKPAVRSLPPVDVRNSAIEYRLQPLSATLFVCPGK